MTNKRLTGEERQRVAADLRDRYDAGATIKQLCKETGRSHGGITILLREAGTQMRPRGTRPADH